MTSTVSGLTFIPSGIMSPEALNVIASLDQSFNALNYDKHIEELHLFLVDTLSLTSKDIAAKVNEIYRNHLNDVVTLLGVFLRNPFVDSLAELATIFNALAVLSTHQAHEVVDVGLLQSDDEGDIYFAEILEFLTGYSVAHILSLVDTVTSDVIDYLHKDTPLYLIMTDMATKAQLRFMESPIPKAGIIVDAIKCLNRFGYNAESLLKAYAGQLSDILHNADINLPRINALETLANEITLLVLGSSEPNDRLPVMMMYAVDCIVDTPDDKLKVNAAISRNLARHQC